MPAYPASRLLLPLLVALLPITPSGALASDERPLIRSPDYAQLRAMIGAAGFDTLEQPHTGILVYRKPGGLGVTAELRDCDDREQCAYLRLRIGFPLHDTEKLRVVVTTYDRQVPLAFSLVEEAADGPFAVVGRDVWLKPGRTSENVTREIQIGYDLANAFLKALLRADPTLAEFWRSNNAR